MFRDTQVVQPTSQPKPGVSACIHCGETSVDPIYVPIADADPLVFCCSGCVAAWHILQNRDLPDLVAAGQAGPDCDPRLAAYDIASVAREYLEEHGQGDDRALRLELDIQGIHCQSCVTVCERSLERLPDLRSATVDYESGRAVLEFRVPPAPVADGEATGAITRPISRAIRQLRLVGYDGVPLKPGRKTEALRREGRGLLWKTTLAGFAAGNTMMLSVALWSGYFDGSLPLEFKRLFEWMQFLFTTPVYLYSARVFHRGWRGLWRTGTVGMDVLISAGISAAYFYSAFVFLRPLLIGAPFPADALTGAATALRGAQFLTGEVYFDSVTMIVFLLLIGRYIEWRARLRQRERVESLLRPLPDYCYRQAETATGDPFELVAVSDLRAGDRVLVQAGETVPADGVLCGQLACELDESVLTGESRPVLRSPGDRLLAGSRLVAAKAVVRVNGSVRESSLGILSRMTEWSGSRRSRIERFTARIIPYFGLGVLGVAFASFFYFYWIAGAGLQVSLLTAVSVLIVSCPCALALSVPTAAGAALFLGLREGVLFRDGQVLEGLDRVRHFCFDKTGTLTAGRHQVVASEFPASARDRSGDNPDRSGGAPEWVRWILRMESGSVHPIGQALLNFAREYQNNWSVRNAGSVAPDEHAGGPEPRQNPGETRIVAGRGLWLPLSDSGRPGDAVHLGAPDFLRLDKEGLARIREFASAHPCATVVGLARGGQCLAMFALSDEPRHDARATLEFLRARGCRISLLTGDHALPAAHLGEQLGLAPGDIHAQLLPAQKARFVTRTARETAGTVCMVGDGFNDAPALAAADISVVHALGAPLSLEQAGIVLLNNRLGELRGAVRIAGAARKVMRVNLAFSLLYNSVMIPLAATGMLLPIWCALFMALSSLTIIGSSAVFRLRFRAENGSGQR